MRESPMRYSGGHVSSSERTNLSSRSARRWVLALTSMASLMVMLDMLVVTTALSTIRLHLGASIEQLEWTVNAYTLSLAVLLMTASALGDRFGRRRLLVAGLGLFTAASAACALAPSVGWLIAARAVQGAGAAMVVPLAMALLGAAFPAEQRARALGFFSGVTGLATVGGPLVGGAVVQGLAWQWIFWLNVPIGLLLIPLVLSRIEEGLGSRTSLDLGGLALVTGAALGLVWGLVRANGSGWGSLEVVASLAAGALLLVAFVAGMLLQAAGFAWIALIARPGLAYPAMVPPLVVAGCGVSMAMPAAQNAVIGAVPRSAIGKASGTFNTLRQLGGTFGIAILAAVFAGTGGYASAQAFSDGFAPAIGVAAGLSLVAAVAGLWTT